MSDSHPGIDITRQPAGTTIMVETDLGLYELIVVNPQQSIVQITGSDPRFHKPILGRLLQSVSVLEPVVQLNHWIGRAMKMVIAFRGEPYTSGTVLSATVKGPGWHYDVF